MPTLNADVVVVGAGPAGACAAAWLARHGYRVVLSERFRSPRARYSTARPIGESLLGKTLPLLHDLGLREPLGEHFLRKRGAVALWGRAERTQPLDLPPTNYSYQVHRPVFDTLLARRAQELGARLLTGHQVVDLVLDGGTVAGVDLEGPAGRRRVEARYVLDASGLARTLSRRLQLPVRPVGPHHWSVFGHVLDAGRLEPPRHHDTITEATGRGWIWFIPLSRRRTSIGFVGLDREKVSGRLWEDLWAEIGRTRIVKPLCAGSRALGPASCRAYRGEVLERLWGPGFALLGDAAGFVDPLLSTGVHVAVYSAYLAAACVDATLGGRLEEAQAGAYYQQTLTAHLDRVAALIDTIYGGYAPHNELRRSRQLHDMDASAIDQLEKRLGPLSMFILGPASEQLELPSELERRVHQYRRHQARVQPLGDEVVLRRADQVGAREALVVKRARLLPGFVFEHARSRFAPVEVEQGSLPHRVWRELERPMSVEQLAQALARQDPARGPGDDARELRVRVGQLLSTYLQQGIVEPAAGAAPPLAATV